MRLGETGSLLATVAISVLVIELAAVASLFPRMLLAGVDLWTAPGSRSTSRPWRSPTPGFLPPGEGLAPFAHDPWFLIVLMLGVILGAIGFPVIYVLCRIARLRPRAGRCT